MKSKGSPIRDKAVYTSVYSARSTSLSVWGHSTNPGTLGASGRSSFQQAMTQRSHDATSGSHPLRRVEKQSNGLFPASVFQVTKVAALGIPETSFERLVPFCGFSGRVEASAKFISLGRLW